MDKSAILLHVHSSLYDIPLHVRARHCGQSVLLPGTFKITFITIVNNCAKGLRFSAFIILWLMHIHMHM